MDADAFETRLRGAREGAEWAWTAIYRDLAPTVLRYVRAHGANDPEDLTGDVFVSVVRKIAEFRGSERDFRAWVLTIAHHRLVDEWRRAGRQRTDLMEHDALDAHLPPAPAASEHSDRLDGEAVLTLMRTLSAQQREVLYLRVVVQLSVDEVARVVGNTPGAVKALQNRALAAIRREMAKGPVSS